MCPFFWERDTEHHYVPLTSFISWLARGWQMPFIVEPLPGNHGRYSLMLWRWAPRGRK